MLLMNPADKKKIAANVIILLSYLLGASSLLLFAVFLFAGNLNLISFSWKQHWALLFNAGLSFLFFIQHSLMVRKSFNKILCRFLPEEFGGTVYSITSGIFLLIVIIFWQSTSPLLEAQDLTRVILRVMFILPIVGFFWAAKSLGFFDPFGIKKILDYQRGKKPARPVFTLKGPYLLVRHPLYFFILIMIWSCPDLTSDRLLFNIIWSVWIIVGTILEERGLVSQFGDIYRKYQKDVPILFPFKFNRARL